MRKIIATVASCVAIASLVVLGTSASASTSAASPASGLTTSAPAFTTTETMSRTYVNNGVSGVDTRTVTLNVDDTTDLHGRQEIGVSWTGARPTGDIIADQNSDAAQAEEYPFVLLECRGDTTAADPVTPSSCWTQSWNERFQSTIGNAYPPYRLDQDLAPGTNGPINGQPATLPKLCTIDLGGLTTQYWVPWEASGGKVYPGGNSGCAGEPPEASDVGGSSLPSNETFGVTGLDGTGSAQFDVFTADENATLGCSQTVACSLVAVPIMGINCSTSGLSPAPTPTQLAQCEATGASAPGALAQSPPASDLTVSGSLWWSPSNWKNHITVPLSFAPLPGACAVVNSNNVIDIYGSELMFQATSQWEPSFCLSNTDKFSFVHVQTGEPQARNLVATGSAEAALTSYAQPLGYGKPVVSAPVGVTGFAISYAIDGSNGQPYTSLKLTPLLLAKLLTESYPGSTQVRDYDPALTHNPLNITDDPEFIALNPGITQNVNGIGLVANTEAESELMALSGDSDVMHALTTYINDDPTARAWLNGTPDQWGMVVNPAYKGIALPVDQWPLLSTFEPTAWYKTDANDCLFNNPVPIQPLIAAPLATLAGISEDVQYDLPNSTTNCSQPDPSTSAGEKLVAGPQQSVGLRFDIGVTTLADAARYQLQTAALQTTKGTFVGPDNASLEAIGALLQPDSSTGTWPIPYTQFEQTAGAAAYPGTMVVYAAVPTRGLPTEDAQDFGTLLRFAATTGQTPGTGVGELPPGYLPMTAANGLGALAAYTVAAAADVAAQNGQVPGVVPGTTQSTPSSSTTAATSPYPFASRGYSSAPFSISGNPALSSAKAPGHGASSKQTISLIQPVGRTIGFSPWAGVALIMLVASLGLLGALFIPPLLLFGRRRGRW